MQARAVAKALGRLSASWRISLGRIRGNPEIIHMPGKRANRKSGFRHLRRGVPLFKRRMVGRELPREFFAEGRIPGEFLKFADVNAPYPLSIFPGLDST